MTKGSYLATAMPALPLALGSVASAQIPAKKPNIVMIMADDVGIWNQARVGGSLSIERQLVQNGASGGGK
jgi:hypothetical protein